MEKEDIDIEQNIELRSEEFQEVLGAIPPWILRWGITLVGVIAILILIGSAIFKYPDIISSTITLTGTTPPATVVAKASGNLKELYVIDNQEVKAGDFLAVVENSAKTEDIKGLKEYLDEFSIENDKINTLPDKNLIIGNIQSLYSSFYITLSEYRQFKTYDYYLKKVDFMKDRINRNQVYYNNMLRQKIIVEKQMKLTHVQFSRDSVLNKKGVLSSEEFEKSHAQYLQGLLSLENTNSTLDNLQIQIAQMNESLLDAENQYIEKKDAFETQLRTYITQLKTEIQTWELNYILISPIEGKITFAKFWTQNQNISTGEDVFTIVPTEDVKLLGKAILPIARSGKVKVGQKVNIRFQNFPDNEFGMIKGVVKNISLVPSKNNELSTYVVEVDLPDGLMTTYKKTLPYLPEMEGQADIITDDLTLLERFLLPIRRVWTESII